LKHLALELNLQSFFEDHGVALALLHLNCREIDTLGYPPLGLGNRQRVKLWHRAMQAAARQGSR
jgi:hypothetical protein